MFFKSGGHKQEQGWGQVGMVGWTQVIRNSKCSFFCYRQVTQPASNCHPWQKEAFRRHPVCELLIYNGTLRVSNCLCNASHPHLSPPLFLLMALALEVIISSNLIHILFYRTFRNVKRYVVVCLWYMGGIGVMWRISSS